MSARNRLGIERAKKMIAICTNTQKHVGDDFVVSLAVIDGEIQAILVPMRAICGYLQTGLWRCITIVWNRG